MKESGGGWKQGMPSPCTLCKLPQRRCAQDCVFAPNCPADEPHKFANVHEVFGASNVNKMFQENNHDEEARVVSSAGAVVAREFFPLVPDLNTKEVGDPRQEILPAQPRANYAEEVSTELTLLFDPYKIEKTLTQSDVGHLSRLLIGRDFVKSHFLRWISKERVRQVESGKQAKVIVWDEDTGSEHQLVFVLWASGSYVLKRGWIKEFVKRRGLAVGDEVGMYWDPFTSKFHFSLLRKAN